MLTPIRAFVTACLIVAAFGACSAERAQPERDAVPSSFVLRSRWVFDGYQLHDDWSLLVRDGVIASLGPEVAVDEDLAVFDLGESTVTPGLIDLHVHLDALAEPEQLYGTGVTTVRDLGSSRVLPSDFGGLHVYSAGPLLSSPRGIAMEKFPMLSRAIRDRRAARQTVRDLVDDGADVVKVYLARESGRRNPLLMEPVLRAIVTEAHRHGLSVTAHVDEEVGFRRAVNAGVDEFAHAPCQPIPDALIERAVARGISMIPTLHVQDFCPHTGRNARRFYQAGGDLYYGTDLGNRGIPIGVDFEELDLMQEEIGLPPTEVLRRATGAAAEYLGAEGGVLAEGAPADLIVTDGNVLEDFSRLRGAKIVILNGKPVRGERHLESLGSRSD